MSLSKDDPIYYKKKITDLIKQAKENGLKIEINNNSISFSNDIGECASVKIS